MDNNPLYPQEIWKRTSHDDVQKNSCEEPASPVLKREIAPPPILHIPEKPTAFRLSRKTPVVFFEETPSENTPPLPEFHIPLNHRSEDPHFRKEEQTSPFQENASSLHKAESFSISSSGKYSTTVRPSLPLLLPSESEKKVLGKEVPLEIVSTPSSVQKTLSASSEKISSLQKGSSFVQEASVLDISSPLPLSQKTSVLSSHLVLETNKRESAKRGSSPDIVSEQPLPSHSPSSSSVPIVTDIRTPQVSSVQQASHQKIPLSDSKKMLAATKISSVLETPSSSRSPEMEKKIAAPASLSECKKPTVLIKKEMGKIISLPQVPSAWDAIDRKNVEKVGEKQAKQSSSRLFSLPRFQKSSVPKPKQSPRKSSSFLMEATRFAVTSMTIFLLSFGAMNYPALRQMISARLDPRAMAEKQIALQNVTKNAQLQVPTLPTAGLQRETRKTFPSLNIGVGPLENRIVIPKIGKNVPIVEIGPESLINGDWKQLEKDIQDGLREGVVHYPGTAIPGQFGNVFITGHSSYYPWDSGKFKDVFALLHDLDVGDEFTVFWNRNAYHYRINERKVVTPQETEVLHQPTDKRIATLMTCTPVGTAKNRLVLVAEQI